MQNERIPELLAPAGNLESALTAYKYGADAVYAGLGRFNAREMGQNFSLEEMSKLSAHAKKLGRRFYLTLNTLVKDPEVEALLLFLDRIRDLEPDGVIVQDLGVREILRQGYPELPVHASTQMGFHNSAGLETAAGLGFQRVILERQVTLEELRAMVPGSPVEVEVFIHGALCCGLSGHCLFSSWIGGWSGNRGRCKQPCRRRYHGTWQGEKVSGFFFSPQDLYTLDIIGELKALGIASLKIEGRLKQPDYVRNVVSAYRMVLDAPPGKEEAVLGEARLALSGSFGRRWSHGFYFQEEFPELLQYDSMGVSGQLVGTVRQAKDKGFQVKLSRRIHVGDRLRIQPRSGEEGPAVTVTRMSLGSRSVTAGRKDDTVFIHCDREVPVDGMVYRIGESRREELPDTKNLPEHHRPRVVDLEIRLDREGMTVRAVELSDGQGNPLEMNWPESPEPAGNRPLTGEVLETLFSATRDPLYRTGRVITEIRGDWFIPASVQKQRRREFWELVSREAAPEGEKAPTRLPFPSRLEAPQPEPPVLSLFAGGASPGKSAEAGDTGTGQEGFGRIVRVVLPGESGPEDPRDREVQLPHFCPEKDLPALKAAVERELASGTRRFRITGLYQFALFRDRKDLFLTVAYPLPAANSFAAASLQALGTRKVQAWVELESEALSALAAHSPLPLEIYAAGRPFLLATRAPVHVSGTISDSRGTSFSVQKDSRSGFTYIYPREILTIPAPPGLNQFRETLPPGEQETSTFNFYQVWV